MSTSLKLLTNLKALLCNYARTQNILGHAYVTVGCCRFPDALFAAVYRLRPSGPSRHLISVTHQYLNAKADGNLGKGTSPSPRTPSQAAPKPSEVQVLDVNGKPYGTLPLRKAELAAKNRDLKLLLVDAESEPLPTYQFVTAEEYRMEQMKLRKIKQANKQPETKVVRIGIKIAKHDLDIKVSRVIEWLQKGHPIKFYINFSQNEMGMELIFNDIVAATKEFAVVQQAAKTAQEMTFQLQPKIKVEEIEMRRTTTTQDDGYTAEEEIMPPMIYHGETIKDRKSVFHGHVARITHAKEVSAVLCLLKCDKLTEDATHFMLAFRVEKCSGDLDVGCEDGGEQHVGQRLLRQLTTLDVRNVVLIVTRWHGGVNLGSARFRHISHCARQVLEQHGYIN